MINLRSILLVEDNPNDVELTIQSLFEHNLANRVLVVKDSVEAVEYLRYEGAYFHKKEDSAVALLDIKMPRMDGIDVLKTIREDSALKMLPVVMLSSSREEPDLIKCYELGGNAYIVKSVNFNNFFETVKHLGVFWALINEFLPNAEI